MTGPPVTLKRDRAGLAGWPSAPNYPADSSKVRKLLIDLSQLETVEEKTSNSKLYPQLGVEDVKDPKATGVRVELTGLEAAAELDRRQDLGHAFDVRPRARPGAELSRESRSSASTASRPTGSIARCSTSLRPACRKRACALRPARPTP